jgi:mercuric ion transport protein
MMRAVELVYFEGCPNAEKARDVLGEAFSRLGLEEEWTEWDLTAPGCPERVRRFGSPTILVNGADVTGPGSGAVAMACRADGVPRLEQVLRALDEA